MFKSIRIQNFRQFRDLKLEGLGQINLITGKNDTGKTSLLEALFIQATPTNPETVLSIARLRGIEQVAINGAYAWGFMFKDGQANEPIVLQSHRDDGVQEKLRIRISDDLELPIDHDADSNGVANQTVLSTSTSSVPALDYEYEVTSGSDVRRGVSRIRVTEHQRITQRAKGFTQRPFYFLAQGPASAEFDAERFSRLVEARRKEEVVSALRSLEPRLEDLEVLALRPSTVTADLGSGPLVPVGYMGRGFERLLTLILAILGSPNGIVMVDEIDDGLHYSVMPGIWKAVIAAATAFSVQVFATTHSLECIEAAVKGSEGHEGTLAFFRLDRRNGDIEVVAGEDHRLRSAVRVGAEIR
jgi:predicted ATPase